MPDYFRFVSWCRTYVPAHIRVDLEAIKEDDAAVKDYGERLAVTTIRELHASGGPKAIHFFTLNMIGSMQVRPRLTKASWRHFDDN